MSLVKKLDPLQGHPRYIPGLDGVRALSFFLIFVFHVWYINRKKEIIVPFFNDAEIDLTYLFSQGYLGVPFFFILSGFLLSLPFFGALSEGRALPSASKFFRNRLLRIVPAYYTAIMVIILFSSFIPCNGCEKTFWSQLLTHLSFTHTFTEFTMAGIASPMWAVGVEVHFYVLLPVLMWFFFEIGRRRGMLTAGILLILMVSAYFTLKTPGWIEFCKSTFNLDDTLVKIDGKVPIWNIFHLFSIFLIGVVAAYLRVELKKMRWAYMEVMTRGSLFFSGVLVVGYLCVPDVKYWMRSLGLVQSSYGWPALPLIFGVFILALALRGGLVNKILEWPPLKIMGLMSFGMYLYHMTVLHTLNLYFPDMRESIIIWSFWSLALTFVLSVLSYLYIEIPLLKKKG